MGGTMEQGKEVTKEYLGGLILGEGGTMKIQQWRLQYQHSQIAQKIPIDEGRLRAVHQDPRLHESQLQK
jgi:hypothetical protein